MNTLSTEVAEAVRLRDAATKGPWFAQRRAENFVDIGCATGVTASVARWHQGEMGDLAENSANAALIAAAPQHVDLIERLFNALKATQDAYVETSAALTLEQDRNEGLHARVRELEALIRTIDDALSE